MTALPATLLCLLVCFVVFGGALPTPENEPQTTGTSSHTSMTSSSSSSYSSTDDGQGPHVVATSQVESSGDGYFVKVFESQVKDKCVSKLTIKGQGINKTVDYPCGKAPVAIVILNKQLLVGDEWYSGEPNVLVHLSNNQCQKEVFTEQDGKSSSSTETLSEDECAKVRTKIADLKKEQQTLLAQQQLEAQHVQQVGQWLQNQLFGPFFGGI